MGGKVEEKEKMGYDIGERSTVEEGRNRRRLLSREM